MTDSLKLTEMQRTSIEFERQRHLANWFIKSSPHMAQPTTNTTAAATATTTTTTTANATQQQQQQQQALATQHCGPTTAGTTTTTTTAQTAIITNTKCNGGTSALGHLGHVVEGRKPKLRRFNSHDTSSNMFSVADFENARLARRNEIELKQRQQRRMRNSANGIMNGGGYGCASATGINGAYGATNGACGVSLGLNGADYSTGDSKASKYSNDSQHEPLPADIFLDRYTLPRVVRISYKTKFSQETLQSSSSSSNGSSTVTSSHSSTSGTTHAIGTGNSSSGGTTNGTGTATSSSTASSSGGGNINQQHGNTNNNNSSGCITKHTNANPSASTLGATATNNSTNGFEQHSQNNGELFLLYRLIRQRHIYHGHNAKTAATNRKKGVLIPQEFPGYFSLLNEKGLPTATLYTSLIQLVRERVYKFVSVDNMPAFTESQPNANSPPNEGCLPIYTTPPSQNRPQYMKTTARGGQVFRLLAVFEDGKQDHNSIAGNSGVVNSKPNSNHGRDKEKGRFAQLLNENRQVMFVSLSTKGKFYEIEPGIPQILQKLGGMQNEANKKINAECVHRITALITPNKEFPLTLRYISGPSGCASAIPENLCISKITTENVVIACPIEDVEVQSPLHLRKLHLTKEMNLIKNYLGFESEQRMLANPNVQNILKFCQFNCDQFLKLVEIEILSRAERSGSKSRVDGLKILKPLHLPKLLRREKTTISAHEKEDSIIFLSKTDLANLEAKDSASVESSSGANRISDKMKVFQSTKKKWFKKQDKHAVNSLTSLELDVQAKRMSMERYTDMSKLLQERFGDKPNTSLEQESISEPSGASDIGCSDTETTTLTTIEQKLQKYGPTTSLKSSDSSKILQKSMSLQDIELISGGQRKPDLLATHNTDTISEAGTELDDLENQAPLPQSFITEKLYNEFHVKTRQYSKSSSSLHQLLNFSRPQKMQLQNGEQKRSLAQLKSQPNMSQNKVEKRLDFNIGEPVTGRRAAGGLSLLAGGGSAHNPLLHTSSSFIEDDLPYSSVRDSLVLSSDESPTGDENAANIRQALNLIDYTKENIYAEICHDGLHRDTYSVGTHSTQISMSNNNNHSYNNNGVGAVLNADDDDYGDYASLSYNATASLSAAAAAGKAISRVQIHCSASPVSYHTVYLGDEPLGERYAEKRRGAQAVQRQQHQHQVGQHSQHDRAHVTTVELAGGVGGAAHADFESVDNIYNTLK